MRLDEMYRCFPFFYNNKSFCYWYWVVIITLLIQAKTLNKHELMKTKLWRRTEVVSKATETRVKICQRDVYWSNFQNFQPQPWWQRCKQLQQEGRGTPLIHCSCIYWKKIICLCALLSLTYSYILCIISL